MKADELMIGDWVEPDQCMIPIVYCKILGIYPDDTVNLDKAERLFTLDELHPIPLTPEILEKNGWSHEFDKTDYMVKYDLGKEGKDCWMMWSVKEHNLDVQRQDAKYIRNLKVSRVVIPCDYVHQLQHALSLCGIEKEIEL